MPTRKEKLLRAADKLDEAREAMNHGGRHWIKGYLRRYIEKNHVPGARGYITAQEAGYRGDQSPVVGFCSIGALLHVKAPMKAKQALNGVVNKKGFGSVIEFNDLSTTKWSEVSRAFRSAARQLRKEAAEL